MTVVMRFHGELLDLAPPTATVDFDVAPTVKDAVEGLGVPHTEVDRSRLDLAARLAEGATYDVHPATHDDRPVPATFAVDVHLAALARRLRLLGFDAVDGASATTDRIVLTRDRGLLKHSSVAHGRLVRSEVPDDQLVEVVRAFRLAPEAAPFTRCTACNGTLRPVARDDVAHRLEPGTLATYDEFRQCRSCGRAYWRGAHHDRLAALVDRALRGADGLAPAEQHGADDGDHAGGDEGVGGTHGR